MTILSRNFLIHGRGGKGGQTTIVSLREESDSKDVKELPKIDNTPVVVPPETSTVVLMNNSDVNRIVCPVDIKDVVFLKEKGVSVKVTGKDAFVNFRFVKKGEKTLYATEPTEMYVVCGQDTYNLVVVPKSNVPPQTVRLSSGIERKIKSNSDLLGGLPFEKKVMRVVKDVYTDQLADSYSATEIKKQVGNWQEITIIHKRNVDIEGEGLRVKEYETLLRQGQLPFKLSEKIFTKKPFAENPVAISLEKHIVRPGETVRIFIVEQRQEKLQKSLYRSNESTELNPLDDQLAMRALEASSEREEKKLAGKTEREEEADE
ncbi:hypothetical protein A2G06_16600 (plasmid) [Geobacter anodireducens]|nr:hypothetical protein A2G06_16600 [Geobacter anodireducens]